MQRYAMIGPDGRPRRIVSGTKPHEDALPIEYPQLSESHVTHHIQQKHPDEWEVRADKVVVTYDIAEKNLEREKMLAHRRIKQRRDEAIQGGITVDIGGTSYQFPMDDHTIARVDQAALDAERRPDGWQKRWHLGSGQWVSLDATQIETIRSTGADHVEAAFNRHEALQGEIDAATTLQELADVNIESGWPEG